MEDDDEIASPAERMYAEGKRFDWKQDKSPAAATLARANFQQAAAMGHKGAVRALAHMLYEGRGGEQDRAKGLLLLWSAYQRGDEEALEEFTDLLASYGEEADSNEHRRTAKQLAESLEVARLSLSSTRSFMHRLASEKSQSAGFG
jgi:TPR repeat protein